MKKLLFFLGSLLLSLSTRTAMNVSEIDSPFWFAGMNNPELQLMVYGKGTGQAFVSVNYPGVSPSSVVELESSNYPLVYLHPDKDVKPGKVPTTFTLGKKKLVKDYELKARSKVGVGYKGFDISDVLYLLVSDHSASGDPDNDQVEGIAECKVDYNDPNVRHDGDLAGIGQSLDYSTDLGVTTLWFIPALENNMKGGSHHSYTTTDCYKVDPHLGTNEECRSLIDRAHNRGIKVVADMILDHYGAEHSWTKNMPSRDWFNHFNFKDNSAQVSCKLTPHVDPYASQYDFDRMNNGWFVEVMPDLSQRDPYAHKHLLQNNLWRIECADIDNARMDAYLYTDYDAMNNWMRELNEGYPNYSMVDETQVTEPAHTAWWQKDSKLLVPRNNNLKTVMDFSFFDKTNTVKDEGTDTWFKGLDRVYNNLVYDYLHPDPASVLAFIENHDADRSLGEGENLGMLKQASTLLLTTRHIPRLYYGAEVMMNGIKSRSDSYVRKDFPSGWANDKENIFTPEGRTKLQNESYNFYRNLSSWRKGDDVIVRGSTKQLVVRHGVYAYAREYNGEAVFVLLNGTGKEVRLPLKYYVEALKSKTQGKNVTSGKMIIPNKELTTAPCQSMIIELQPRSPQSRLEVPKAFLSRIIVVEHSTTIEEYRHLYTN